MTVTSVLLMDIFFPRFRMNIKFLVLMQAYNLSRDHKPDLEAEKERILKAGGFIHAGRVNGSLNLARAIGTFLGDLSFLCPNLLCVAPKFLVTLLVV